MSDKGIDPVIHTGIDSAMQAEIRHDRARGSAVSRCGSGLEMTAAVALGSAAGADSAKVIERDVNVPTTSGIADAALFYPDKSGSWPAVLVWADVAGLRPVFREIGQRLAAEGYVVLVPNMFYRSARAPIVDASFDFNKPEDKAKVMPMIAALTADANIRDAKSYVEFLDAQPQTDKTKKMGVHGYCMGGPLALRTAAAVPERVGAAASFHGGGLATDKPESPHLLIPKMRAEVLCCVAENDDQRDPVVKDKLKAAFAAAHLKATVEVYRGCNHGWTVRGSRAYNEEGAERAWGELLALYRRSLV